MSNQIRRQEVFSICCIQNSRFSADTQVVSNQDIIYQKARLHGQPDMKT